MATSSFWQDRGTGRAWWSVGEIFAYIYNDRPMWFKSPNPGSIAKRDLGDTVAKDHGMQISGSLSPTSTPAAFSTLPSVGGDPGFRSR
jgi:hypothetical protein